MICTQPLVSLLGVCVALTPLVRADDLSPPWYRGHTLSTRSVWEFTQPPTSFFDIYADSFSSVAGPPQYPLWSGFPAKAEVDDAANWSWTQGDGDGGLTLAPGVSSASIGFKIPNFVDDLDTKLLRVQITWHVALPPIVTGVTGYNWLGFGNYIPFPGTQTGSVIVSTSHFYEDWIIHPNPNWDLVSISMGAGTILDEVVIDTVSIPSGGTAPLLLSGCLLLARRARR